MSETPTPTLRTSSSSSSSSSPPPAAGREPDVDPRSWISCMDCLNALAYCFSPRHQFDSYWREGEFDLCGRKFKELRFCMALKVADDHEAAAMLRELLDQGRSPTEGKVWQARPPQDPGLR